jgi:hypothetical protein
MGVYKNITTGTNTTLITKGGSYGGGTIKKITIANVDGHTADNVCVYLENASGAKFYFIKDVDIPVGTTLVLDDNVSFHTGTYHLKLTTQNASDGGTPNLTVIIK